jgi:putative methylase
VPPHPKPRLELEQYATPGDLAARWLVEAAALGDIEGKSVVDLGCGTGVLAIGAAMLGATHVVGADVDVEALSVARESAARLGVDVQLVEADVVALPRLRADTVIMNPPFGAQKPGADRPFLDAAFDIAPVVYSLHNADTRAFVERYATERGFSRTHAWAMRFALPQQYRHQARASVDVDVVALRWMRRDSDTAVRQ